MGKVFAIATEVCSNILYIIEKATYSRGVSCTEFYYGSFLCTEFPILFLHTEFLIQCYYFKCLCVTEVGSSGGGTVVTCDLRTYYIRSV